MDHAAVAQVHHHVADLAAAGPQEEHDVPPLEAVQRLMAVLQGHRHHHVDQLLAVPDVVRDAGPPRRCGLGELVIHVPLGIQLHPLEAPGDDPGAVEGEVPRAVEVAVGGAQAVVDLGDQILDDQGFVVVDGGVDAAGGVEAFEHLAGRKAVHPLHPAILEAEDAVVSQIYGASGDPSGMLAGDHELTALHDPLAPLGQLAEEQDVALLQLAAGGHVLPLGPMAVKAHQAPGGVEELEEERIVYVVLVVLGVFLIVLQHITVNTCVPASCLNSPSDSVIIAKVTNCCLIVFVKCQYIILNAI